ncbi:hypothetical protein CTA1_12108 [Colletotrichum tanaceti]|uniref:Uncharacterized protein n=1 Tax=Colletotrichum tanaceti TaxID=1306861 RepID=A0A4U6XQV1_9PEZI|nr:hypothetical protein CTA1_12108 [Colletotrichum tanaceti]
MSRNRTMEWNATGGSGKGGRGRALFQKHSQRKRWVQRLYIESHPVHPETAAEKHDGMEGEQTSES